MDEQYAQYREELAKAVVDAADPEFLAEEESRKRLEVSDSTPSPPILHLLH